VEWEGHLNGVEQDGGRWLWGGRRDIDNEVEDNVGEVFVGNGHDTADDSSNSFTCSILSAMETFLEID
jgi:hypothetical protein